MSLIKHQPRSLDQSVSLPATRPRSLPDEGVIEGLVEGWRVWRLSANDELQSLCGMEAWPVGESLRAMNGWRGVKLLLFGGICASVAVAVYMSFLWLALFLLDKDLSYPYGMVFVPLTISISLIPFAQCHWRGEAPCDGGHLGGKLGGPLTGCGIFAYKSKGQAMDFLAELVKARTYKKRTFIIGRVALWGKVVEHESGYRGELAYPLEFTTVRLPAPGVELHESVALLAELNRRYNTEAAKS